MTLVSQCENELLEAVKNGLKSYCEALGPNELIKPAAKALQLQAEAQAEIVGLKKSCQMGFQYLNNAVQALSNVDRSIDFVLFKANLEQAFGKLNSRAALDEYSQKIMSGSTWRAVLGLTDVTLDLFYKGAQQIFAEKRFSEAETAFYFLTLIDPMQYAFWIGLGHSRFHQDKFKEAVSAYQMASLCDPFQLWPYFFSANCFEREEDFEQALICLEDAQECFKNQGLQDTEMEEVIGQRIAAVKQKG